MIIDVTGAVLVPGNFGVDCLGNGEGREIECCCEECDYMLCCIDEKWYARCGTCGNRDCPRYGIAQWPVRESIIKKEATSF